MNRRPLTWRRVCQSGPLVLMGATASIGRHPQVWLRALADSRSSLLRARPPRPVDGGTAPSPDPRNAGARRRSVRSRHRGSRHRPLGSPTTASAEANLWRDTHVNLNETHPALRPRPSGGSGSWTVPSPTTGKWARAANRIKYASLSQGEFRGFGSMSTRTGGATRS